MCFLELMQKRYTTKLYDNTKIISIEIIRQLEEILLHTPSSLNSQPWKFTFVTNKELKSKLANASYSNSKLVKDSFCLVVFNVLSNVGLQEQWMEDNLSGRAIEYYNKNIKKQPSDKIIDWFAKQVYLSLGVFLSACAALEIDSTPLEGIDCTLYDNILEHNDFHTIVAVAIGYRDLNDTNQLIITPKQRKDNTEVIEEYF